MIRTFHTAHTYFDSFILASRTFRHTLYTFESIIKQCERVVSCKSANISISQISQDLLIIKRSRKDVDRYFNVFFCAEVQRGNRNREVCPPVDRDSSIFQISRGDERCHGE